MRRIIKEARNTKQQAEYYKESRIKKIFNFKYHKIVFLILCILAAYLIFRTPLVQSFFSNLKEYSYLGIFIAGIFFAFGFTAPIAVGIFIVLSPSNLFLAAVLGAIGAVIGDMLIFRFIKVSFEDEIELLENEKPFLKIRELIHKHSHLKLYNYLLYIFAGFCIASPLPDEVGIMLLAGLTKINPKIFSLMSFVLHFIGIYIVVSI